MFSQDGSLLPSSYADARFIDAVIFSKALTDYVHSKGLKFGLYTARGSGTCQGRPGSLNHELIDAATYCDWGIDYIKIDGASDSTGTAALVTAHVFARARAQTTRTFWELTCACAIRSSFRIQQVAEAHKIA